MARETIVCAFAQRASGPGWANSPLWYIVRDGDGKMRMECLQPDEQTAQIGWLYATSAALHNELLSAVEDALAKKTKRRRRAA